MLSINKCTFAPWNSDYKQDCYLLTKHCVISPYPLLPNVTLLFSFERFCFPLPPFSSLFLFLKTTTVYHFTSAAWLYFSTALTTISEYKKDEL